MKEESLKNTPNETKLLLDKEIVPQNNLQLEQNYVMEYNNDRMVHKQTTKHKSICMGRTVNEVKVESEEHAELMELMCRADEADIKIEIKEEQWWEGESTLQEGIEEIITDEDFPVSELSRLSRETSYHNGSGTNSFLVSPALNRQCSFLVKTMGNDKVPEQTNESSKREINSDEKCVKYYKCEICDRSFTYLPTLKRHMLSHKTKNGVGIGIDRNQQKYKCKICRMSFISTSAFESHILSHKIGNNSKRKTGEKIGKCIPNNRNENIGELDREEVNEVKSHNLSQRIGNVNKCKIDEKTQTLILKKKSRYTGGKKVDELKRKYQCNNCDKRFYQLSHLKRHQMVHDGTKPYQCAICDRSFYQVSALKAHQIVHDGTKPFECLECGSTFQTSSNLKRHHLIHQGKRPFTCDVCEKSFSQLAILKRHLITHEASNKHKCKICGKTFSQISSLKRHVWIHEGQKPYRCELCARSFTRLLTLKKHMSFIHNTEEQL